MQVEKAVGPPQANLVKLEYPFHPDPFTPPELAMTSVKKNKLNRYRIRFGTERGRGYSVDFGNNS